MDKMDNVKILLSENEIPRKWYNLAADLPTPMLPPLGPDGQPVRPEMLAPVFPMNLIEQEVSTQRWIDIPHEVLDILYRWRPSPLRRAVYLERFLKTPAKIYFKDESVSPAGSHKPNTAVPQAWYNKQFNYSGHGLMDLAGYDAYLSGKLTDYTMPESEILENLAKLAGMPKAEARKTGKW
jgi:predicted alternative tryptophan synthase beta-subunit